MTTTNIKVGIGNQDRISSKVLKPPGGETHDIFGTRNYRGGLDNDNDIGMGRRQQHQQQRANLQSSVFESNNVIVSSEVDGEVGSSSSEDSKNSSTEDIATSVAAIELGGGGGMNVAAAGITPRSKNGNASNSASRIFGDDETDDQHNQQVQPPRKVKDYLKSNIFGDDSQAFNNNGNVVQVATPQRRTNSNAYGGGNPITGEGYVNGCSVNQGQLGGGAARGGGGVEAKENGNVASTRVRNPPGGHSTKLW